MKWTEDQQKAIDSRHGNFLVSAGAGSGKTAVLTERIKQIVLKGQKEKEENVPLSEREGAAINEILVLTFSNKAAAEMKSRIRESLFKAFKSGELKEDLSPLVEASDITTFDSYFYSLVRKYHQHLGLSKDVTIVEGNFLSLKAREFLDEIFDDLYAKRDSDFLALISRFAFKDDEEIRENVLSLFLSSSILENPVQFLDSLAIDYFSPGYFEKRKKEWIAYQQKEIDSLIEEANNLGDSECAAFLLSFLTPFSDIQDPDALFKAANTDFLAHSSPYKDGRFRLLKEGDKQNEKFHYLDFEDYAAARAISARIKSLFSSFKGIGSFEDNLALQKKNIPYIKEYAFLAKKLWEKLLSYKKEKNVYDFSDIAFLARKVLEDESIREKIRHSYKYVMVDEYQDTSDLQEAFLRKVSHDNLFAVGDMKQSIYRFRYANPAIFLEKFERYSKGEDGTLITLNVNYRSARNVIEDINGFFEEAMSKERGSINYDESQRLLFGNAKTFGQNRSASYETEKILYTPKEGESKEEIEAELIARDIEDKVGRYIVTTKNEKRVADYKDFVILCRSKKCFQTLLKVFGEHKIPFAPSAETDLSGEDTFLLFRRFLRLSLAYGKDEIEEKHSYLSIQRSYLFEKRKDKELIDEVQSGSYKKSAFWKEFGSLLLRLTKMAPSEAVETLLSYYPFYKNLPYIGRLVDNYEKIRTFLASAKVADRLGMSYLEFCSYFLEQEKRKTEEKVSLPPQSENAVRAMSIHVSKGLEFPIVYLASNYPNLFKNIPKETSWNVSKDFGLLLPTFTDKGNVPNLFSRLYVANEKQEALNEEMRILYVGATRAIDKLIYLSPLYDEKETLPVSRHLLEIKVDPDGKLLDASLKDLSSYRDFFFVSRKAFPSFKSLSPKRTPKKETKGREVPLLKTPKLCSIDIKGQELLTNRASKNEMVSLDYAKISYGLKFHKILQNVPFVSLKKPDLSYLGEGKHKVETLLALPFFQERKGYKEFHEYGFFDKEKNLHGSIDLLLVSENECDIIDFKSKEVDDPSYRNQLASYKEYVERVFKRKTRTYLLSIGSSSINELK